MNAWLHIFLIHLFPILISPLHKVKSKTQLFRDTIQFNSDSPPKSANKVSIRDIPHHALIVYGGFYCSGSLIRSQTVLTAASCFLRRRNQKIVVKLGANTMTDIGQIIPAIELKVHEYFDIEKNWNNDIALVILEEHVTFSEFTKKAILIDPAEKARYYGMRLEVAGWGHTARQTLTNRIINGGHDNSLQIVKMEIISEYRCEEFYNINLISATNFCAKYHTDNRLNDNGGGAMNKEKLVGLVSFGATNKKGPPIAVFTNISYFYKWITLNSQRFLEKYCHPTEDPEFYTEYYSESEMENSKEAVKEMSS